MLRKVKNQLDGFSLATDQVWPWKICELQGFICTTYSGFQSWNKKTPQQCEAQAFSYCTPQKDNIKVSVVACENSFLTFLNIYTLKNRHNFSGMLTAALAV